MRRGRGQLVAVIAGCGLAALGLALLISGCGGSSDSGASELAQQQELQAARQQGAQDARQTAKIEELEGKLQHQSHGQATPPASTAAAEAEPSPEPDAQPTETETGDWPGGSGYTAILGSLDSEEEARSLQQRATDAGLDAGILDSSQFSSLRPGYWVVFSGSFSNESEAAARADRAKELGIAGAYPRFVAP